LAASRICVITYDSFSRPDAVVREVVARLRAAGLRLGGLLQDGRPGNATECAMLFLEDIGTGQRIQAFEQREIDARGCRLDASGLATAATWLRQAVEDQPDILFVNRFGRQEVERRGLLDEIALAVAVEMPIVIAVNRSLLPAWHAFAGPDATYVAADADQIAGWCLDQAKRVAHT